MIGFLSKFNFCIFIIFTLCYSYQFVFLFYVLAQRLKSKKETTPDGKQNRFAFVTSARNEKNVIGELIDSIRAQNYPQELIDVYIIADNCTDNTAEIARAHGAKVYERFNKQLIGKGYALDEFFKHIMASDESKNYDGFFVFDADNVLDENFTKEMNKVFNKGYNIVTSYRNSRNYGSNWISAGYALWFLRESKYLSNARMLLNTSCAVSGTGFLVRKSIIEKNNGWKHHLLTEDIEFSIDSVINGEKIGYADGAVIYDEQPITFAQSWNQRLRWSKGFYQVLGKYGAKLVKGMFTNKGNKFSCFDMFMTISPAMFITLFSIAVNSGVFISEMMSSYGNYFLINESINAVSGSLFRFYILLFVVGAITTVTEWNNIHTTTLKKIVYTFTFPLFIATYIPIAIVALFKKVQWTPIAHGIERKPIVMKQQV